MGPSSACCSAPTPPRPSSSPPPPATIPVQDADLLWEWVRRGRRTLCRLAELPFPTVACIEAPAVGAGFELALACSMRVMVRSATAGVGFLPHEGWMVPAWGGSVRLARRLGPTLAWELLRSAALVPSSLALRWGLADSLAEPGALESVAREVSARRPRWPLIDRWLWALPGGADLLIRRLEGRAGPLSGVERMLLDQVRRGLTWPFDEALEEEGRALVHLAASRFQE
ncbi:MAG: enoyl-CoA hydratase/isomerase family protein [Acidobacteriota bacterium]|nr:enoyl-CoA hydratase/isomerase family protein [Acidobacteriota bacterium]